MEHYTDTFPRPLRAFSDISVYYDMLAGGRKRIDREGPLLQAWFERAPGRRVADLACGTGLHALYMAESGGIVTALDASSGMIAYARAHRPHPSIAYGVADMRRLPVDRCDLALCLGNSLSLLASEDDLASLFQGVSGALAPGGIFFAQLLNYDTPSAKEHRHRVERHSMAGEAIVAVKSLIPDGNRTLLSIVFHITDENGTRSLADTAVLRHWMAGDLRRAAESAGLCIAAEYGGFDRAPFEPSASADLIVVAEKPHVA